MNLIEPAMWRIIVTFVGSCHTLISVDIWRAHAFPWGIHEDLQPLPMSYPIECQLLSEFVVGWSLAGSQLRRLG